MNKLYFHPETSAKNNSPVFSDSNQYDSIRYFLRAFEVLEPQAIVDLKELVPLYQETVNNKNIVGDYSEWDIMDAASDQHNACLIPLREAVKSWALKYHLTDQEFKQTIYLVIAVWALGTLSSHDEHVQQMMKIAEMQGRKAPEALIQWSLTNAVYFETEEDDIRLEDTVGESDFDKLFPFAFTPSRLNSIILYTSAEQEKLEKEADLYEELLLHVDNGKEKYPFPWIGEGWDPRQDSWQEFEQEMDEAFAAYKKAYRERTERFMKNNGYIVGPEKRNIEHFQWLVRYQVQGWKVSQIADYYSRKNKIISEDAVYKALKSTAALVGINLRGCV